MAVGASFHELHPSQGKPKDHLLKQKEKVKGSLRSISPDNIGRSSFSSVREDGSDLAQTFTKSKISSYSTVAVEEAIDDSLVPPGTVEKMGCFLPPLTQPQSKLHGVWYPTDSFRGWKQIDISGKVVSKSYGDLQRLGLIWSSAPSNNKLPSRYNPGEAPFERLPMELMNSIIGLLSLDIPPNGLAARNVDLISLLLTSKTIHVATLRVLYTQITIPHSKIFKKFLSRIAAQTELGTLVRRLDFSHFNPASIFETASDRARAQNLTPQTLLQCLMLTPNLQEFLAQEYIDDELSDSVLMKLLWGLPRLQAVDFCGCSSTKFKTAFSSILLENWPTALSIKRLSLHKCLTLSPQVLETLLPRLANLTHLDVAGTKLTNAALLSIPHTARITHLNLAKCNQLSPRVVVDFLASHPAVRDSLVFLSVATDFRSHQLLDVDDLSQLLPRLPSSLKSLSIKGSKMSGPDHVPLLRPLLNHLEELALGRCLTVDDINKLFVDTTSAPAPSSTGDLGVIRDAQKYRAEEEEDRESEEEDDRNRQKKRNTRRTLRYLDLSDLATSAELDLNRLFSKECVVLTPYSAPLEVIEVSEEIFERLRSSSAVVARSGWRCSELGNRAWLTRASSSASDTTKATNNHRPGLLNGIAARRPPADNGRRPWKLGASFWGMRKIPVAEADVGGMYGSFMFGRKL